MKTYQRIIGKLARKEKGKSQAKMGDIMQIANLIFDECLRDQDFFLACLALAQRRREKRRKAKK